MYDAQTKRMTAAEFIIVFLVLSTLAAISVPRLSHSANIDRETRCNSNLELLQSAVDLYTSQNGKYPNKLDTVTNNPDFFPAGAPKCPLGGTYILKTDHTVICTHSY